MLRRPPSAPGDKCAATQMPSAGVASFCSGGPKSIETLA